jgi:hypothetical protein
VNFAETSVNTLEALYAHILHADDSGSTWIYRGQENDWSLRPTLERVLSHSEIGFVNAQKIENQMVRDFRRKYKGSELARVESDTFYCLALMQHHGAPTRLLDCTYSPFVAARFAIKAGGEKPVIWRFRAQWCEDGAKTSVGEHLIESRSRDRARNDQTFRTIYMANSAKRFALGENPFPLNERIILQQGIFLCPGDVTTPFEQNLKSMNGWDSTGNVLKIVLDLPRPMRKKLANVLRQMNLSSDVLFPGLDGFARSFGERIYYFDDLAQRGIGGEPESECQD